jgi:hypothetical protein
MTKRAELIKEIKDLGGQIYTYGPRRLASQSDQDLETYRDRLAVNARKSKDESYRKRKREAFGLYAQSNKPNRNGDIFPEFKVLKAREPHPDGWEDDPLDLEPSSSVRQRVEIKWNLKF